MARYRRRMRRPKANYAWQSIPMSAILATGTSIPAGSKVNWLIGSIQIPGTGESGDFEHFQDDHVLERIVGAMSHNGGGDLASTTRPQWFPFSIGAVKVPAGLSLSSGLNMFDSESADDYLFRMDAVCNQNTSESAVPNWHDVNSKAKRKFSVGDGIQFLASAFFSEAVSRKISIDFSMNLRLLWKLN